MRTETRIQRGKNVLEKRKKNSKKITQPTTKQTNKQTNKQTKNNKNNIPKINGFLCGGVSDNR
jgi:hypothetical protein